MSEGSSNRNRRPYEYSHNIAVQIKRQLTVRGQVYLTLRNIEEGYAKKIRFTVFSLCPKCGGASHVKPVDVELEPNDCEVCLDSQVFTAKTRIFKVYAPIGTRHGSTTLLQDEGSHGPQGIRGDIIVTYLDKPHEHFLRVFDDVIVCFQINREESACGAAIRLLTLEVPSHRDIVLKTKAGESIGNNEFRYVNDLGLPNCHDKRKRGRLIIIFIVKDQRSMFPVKLKDIEMSFNDRIGTISYDENLSVCPSPSTVKSEKEEADTTALGTSGFKSRRPPQRQNTSKRKKGTSNESTSDTSCESLSDESGTESKSKDRASCVETVEETDQARCSRILDNPIDRLTECEVKMRDPLDTKRLSFLDRLVYAQAIPFPYKTPVKDAIPMTTLSMLWERKYDPCWWQRTQLPQSPNNDPTMTESRDPDTIIDILSRLRGPVHSNPKNCVVDTPLFDVREVKLNESAEALKVFITMQSNVNPEYLQFTPQKLSKGEKIKLLNRMRKYPQELMP